VFAEQAGGSAAGQIHIQRAVDVVGETPLERRGHRPVDDTVLVGPPLGVEARREAVRHDGRSPHAEVVRKVAVESEREPFDREVALAAKRDHLA